MICPFCGIIIDDGLIPWESHLFDKHDCQVFKIFDGEPCVRCVCGESEIWDETTARSIDQFQAGIKALYRLREHVTTDHDLEAHVALVRMLGGDWWNRGN